MPLQTQLRLALDTNVLFDRAANHDFAITILEFLHTHEIALIVTYTVLAELGSAVSRPISAQKAELAKRALDCFRTWGIQTEVIEGSNLGIAAEVSNALRREQLLPYDEFHDGCILAEAALAKAQYLVTSDHHLISMDREKTKRVLKAQALSDVHVVSPRSLYIRLKKNPRLA